MKIITKNKRAYHDYDILKTYEAGIVLAWHEVKSIKASQCNIREAIVKASDKELFLIGMDVPLYKHSSLAQIGNYQSKHRRKLLLKKREIAKIIIKAQQDKLHIIPLQIYIAKYGKIKIQIWLAQRLRKVMKKQQLKEKDQARNMDKNIRNLNL